MTEQLSTHATRQSSADTGRKMITASMETSVNLHMAARIVAYLPVTPNIRQNVAEHSILRESAHMVPVAISSTMVLRPTRGP